MRSWFPSLLTAAGVCALLGVFGSVAKGVQVWRTPENRCVFDPRPGFDGICSTTVPVTGLAKVPWGYVGLSVGLLLLAVCLFTLRERIQMRG